MLGKSSLLERADALVHFSYEASNEKFLLVDLQVVNCKWYYPEITTMETLVEAQLAEEFIYTGNLTDATTDIFLQKCNVYCLELKIAEIALGESDEGEVWEQQHHINCIYFKIQHWFITSLLLKVHINVLF